MSGFNGLSPAGALYFAAAQFLQVTFEVSERKLYQNVVIGSNRTLDSCFFAGIDQLPAAAASWCLPSETPVMYIRVDSCLESLFLTQLINESVLLPNRSFLHSSTIRHSYQFPSLPVNMLASLVSLTLSSNPLSSVQVSIILLVSVSL